MRKTKRIVVNLGMTRLVMRQKFSFSGGGGQATTDGSLGVINSGVVFAFTGLLLLVVWAFSLFPREASVGFLFSDFGWVVRENDVVLGGTHFPFRNEQRFNFLGGFESTTRQARAKSE